MTKKYNTDTITDFRDTDDIRVKKVDLFIQHVFEVYEIRERVGKVNNIVFYIYPNEQQHHKPHIHAKFNELDISISLIDFSIIAASKNLPEKNRRVAVEWVKENIEWLISSWDRMHQIKVREFGRKSMLERDQYGK